MNPKDTPLTEREAKLIERINELKKDRSNHSLKYQSQIDSKIKRLYAIFESYYYQDHPSFPMTATRIELV